MMKNSHKKTICALCNQELELNTEIIVKGCPYCGSFKFKTIREMSPTDEKQHELELIIEKELKDVEIQESIEAIRLTDDGVFEVDVEKLLDKTESDQAIIGRDKDGSYFIKFQSEKKVKETED